MKDSETVVRSSSKKANGKSAARKLSIGPACKSNGTVGTKASGCLRVEKTKAMMGAGNSKTKSPESASRGGSPRKGKKESPEHRPRRRASQTYFFKYQLARNPLKAEEEDLKLALLASLQQCGNGDSGSTNNKSMTSDKKPKSPNKNSQHVPVVVKRPVGRPPKNPINNLLASNGVGTTNSKKKDSLSSSTKKGKQYKICANSNNGKQRRGSVESSSSRASSSLTDEERKKLKKRKADHLDQRQNPLLDPLKPGKAKSKVKSMSMSNNDLANVQNKIKKAKKLLQNKQANKNNGNILMSKYSALRKFPLNARPTSSPSRRRPVSSPGRRSDKSKNKSKLIDGHYGNQPTACFNSPSFVPYSPFTPIQKREPPDEDYLKKYKPETEDFLKFICFRSTAPNYHNQPATDELGTKTNGVSDASSPSNLTTGNNLIIHDHHNLKNFASSFSRVTTSSNGIDSNAEHPSPNNHRRPTRQSPRLASSQKKISEIDNLTNDMGTSNTAYDNATTYEEDMKKASIALEDMAHEINSSDGVKHEIAQNSPDCNSKISSSPYKNNKHLVKGLMTREFAGAFADEDTIFEPLSNHKL